METIFDMVERLGHFEVPAAVLHHPVLRQLRQLAADIPSLSNDVRSFPLEAPRGDVNNLVMIVQRERRCTAEEACAAVIAEAQLMVERCAELQGRLPDVYRELGLSRIERTIAQRYADGLLTWLAGYLNGRPAPAGTTPSDARRTPAQPAGTDGRPAGDDRNAHPPYGSDVRTVAARASDGYRARRRAPRPGARPLCVSSPSRRAAPDRAVRRAAPALPPDGARRREETPRA